MNNIWAYTRASTAAQQLSTAVQREKIMAYTLYKFERHPDEYFEDEATHGYVNLDQRPSGCKLLAAAEAGDHIVIAKVDRGFRKIADLCKTLDLLAARSVTLHLLDINVDTASEVGKAMIRMMGVFAELERARIGERTKEALQTRKRMGRPVSKPPYGFKCIGVKGDRRLIPNPAEREFGKMCLEFKKNGYTEDEITMHLLRERVKNPRTKKEIGKHNVHLWIVKETAMQAKEAAGVPLTPYDVPV